MHQFAREFGLLVDRKPEPETEFGIVFKQRIRPGRSAAVEILRPRRSRQVSTVDRRATGRISDDAAISKKLRNQLQIWRLAATGAGSREFKQRLLDLLLTDISDLDLAPIQFWNLEEEIPVLALRFAQRRLRHHVDGFQAGLALVLDGTDIDADAASGAVFGRHLDGVLHPLPVFVAHLGGLESRWRACQLFRIVDLDADYSVRADHGAFA